MQHWPYPSIDPRKLVQGARNFFSKNGDVLWTWLWTRLVLLLIGFFSVSVLAPGAFSNATTSVWDYFFRWDSGWYADLIRGGYFLDATGKTNGGFFPLYPFCVWILQHLGLPLNVTGIIFSNVCLIAGVIQLRRLLEIDYPDSSIPRDAGFFFLINPVTFFYSAFYTESLFFLVTVSFFYALRRRDWLWVGLWGALATATRSFGILIMIPLAWELLIYARGLPKRDWRVLWRPALAAACVPLGLVLFMGVLWVKLGNPFLFMSAQRNWGRELTPFWITLQNAAELSRFHGIFFVGAAGLAFVLILLGRMQHIRTSYLIFASLALLLSVSYRIMEATPRYVSVVFPLYVALALWAQHSHARREAIVIFNVSLLTLCWLLFVNGYWMT